MTTLLVMASSISTSTPFSSASSSINPKPTIYCSLSSSSVISYSKVSKFRTPRWVPVMGLSPFASWSGLKNLDISVKPPNCIKLVQKGRSRRKGVFASLFGVGAPEALVIGVVALLVFGPKGLAEVARNLGKTLRAFQPTIRELQDVSREFKSTLEREIGLDEISNPSQNIYSSNRTNITPTPSPIANTEDSQTVVDPNGVNPPKEAYTSEEYLKITEEQLKAVAAQQQGVAPSPTSAEQTQFEEPQSQPQVKVEEAPTTLPPPPKPESDA